jgi:N-carbamoyl-L-amino-acid hydrolase
MPEVVRERFLRWFGELADIGRTPTGWNRVAWTPLEVEAQRWFAGVATSMGLEVIRDGAGSVWAVTPDADAGPWVCAGSHLDTQPDGGAYDGALGICCALEATAAILEAEVERRRPLAVVAFVDEEGARFRTACFASLAITGRLDIDAALAAMGDAAEIHGVTRESLIESRGQLDRIRCYLEVHVEQGRSLVDRGIALGIADRLTPRQRWRAEFDGESDHAGTRPMAGRRDALVAAAPFILAADEVARTHAGAVATVGRVTVTPGSTNSIPGHVALTLDVRAPEAETIDLMLAELSGLVPAARLTRESRNDGALFDASLRQELHAACDRRAISAADLPSYAGHDAGILAPHVPSAMVFVRNPTGASHTPLESASDDDCIASAQVLADVLAAELGR